MKNQYNSPKIMISCFYQDVLVASEGTYGTIGDYNGEFLV